MIAPTQPRGSDCVSGLRLHGSAHTDAQTSKRILPFAQCRAGPSRTGRAGQAGTVGQLASLQREVMLHDPCQKVLLKNQVLGIATLSLSWKSKMLSGLWSSGVKTRMPWSGRCISEIEGREPMGAHEVGFLQNQRLRRGAALRQAWCCAAGLPFLALLTTRSALWAKASVCPHESKTT